MKEWTIQRPKKLNLKQFYINNSFQDKAHITLPHIYLQFLFFSSQNKQYKSKMMLNTQNKALKNEYQKYK